MAIVLSLVMSLMGVLRVAKMYTQLGVDKLLLRRATKRAKLGPMDIMRRQSVLRERASQLSGGTAGALSHLRDIEMTGSTNRINPMVQVRQVNSKSGNRATLRRQRRYGRRRTGQS